MNTRDNELGRIVFKPVWGLFALAALAFLAGLSLPAWAQYLPFLASVLVLGLPHGAVDHLVVARAPGNRFDHPLAVVGLVYLLAGGTYLLAWTVAPAAAFTLFIALTWYHWGQGDLYALTALSARTYPRSVGQRALCVLVRGGLPMVVPLVAFPSVYRQVARAVTGLFDPAAVSALDPAFSIGTRVGLGGALAVLSGVAIALGYRRADGPVERRSWAVDAGETLLLWAYFLTVPPVLAVGLYFCVWHSLRHIVRVIALGAPSDSGRRKRAPEMSDGIRFTREAAPLTAGALVVFAGLYVLAPVTTLGGTVALYLVLLAVLTLPHVLVVTWLDVRQRLWG